MLDKITGIEARFDEIENELVRAAGNYQRVAELSKERAEIESIVEKAREYRQALKRHEEAEELANGKDVELA